MTALGRKQPLPNGGNRKRTLISLISFILIAGYPMLRYLKWLSIAGVWLPIAGLAAWAGISWAVGAIAPEAGWGFVVIGMALTFALSHALAVSTLVGAGLLVTRHATRPAVTLLSVIVGGSVSALVLSRVYFDFTT